MSSQGEPAVRGTVERHRPARWQFVGVWAIWAVSIAFVLIGVVTLGGAGPAPFSEAVGQALPALSFATVGAILVSRLPRNVIGWLLASGGLCFAVGSGATGLGSYGLSVHSGSVPGAIWLAWLSEWTYVPGVGAVVVLALVYPSGRLLSARWRPVALAAVLLIVLRVIGLRGGCGGRARSGHGIRHRPDQGRGASAPP